ncbi:hypothetical protein HDC30_002475 [Pseudomonas sp. JAI115]|uniref:hypothetical protein n=1 Tax=Pseudomonas sp. JAI115 TaxID=2723061 RepID=UPI00160E3539|nr:hypothetical protein [Pseudomonas sp. JAI115]MBB6155252.1 hypothetical protein [Pseudomonas sp. JAI115]
MPRAHYAKAHIILADGPCGTALADTATPQVLRLELSHPLLGPTPVRYISLLLPDGRTLAGLTLRDQRELDGGWLTFSNDNSNPEPHT